jgi:hypothetical protein
VPVTFVRSAPAGDSSTAYVEPAPMVRLPLTVIVPIEFPGASVPLTTVDGRNPVPPTVPPAPTVSPEDVAMVPLTTSCPPVTEVAPV